MENFFDLKLPVTENYDKTILEIKDGYLQPNIYFKYLIANDAKKFFKAKISSLDVDHNFMRENIVEDVDPNSFEIAKLKYYEKNSEAIRLANEEKEKWKDEHKHFYRMQPSLPSSVKYSNLFNFDINLSLNEAIQGYKLANEVLKSINNSNLDPWCTELKPMLNYEHRDEYNKAMENINKKFNILSDKEIKKTLPLVKVTKTRLSLDRQKCNDPSAFKSYLKNIFDNIKN